MSKRRSSPRNSLTQTRPSSPTSRTRELSAAKLTTTPARTRSSPKPWRSSASSSSFPNRRNSFPRRFCHDSNRRQRLADVVQQSPEGHHRFLDHQIAGGHSGRNGRRLYEP